MKLNTNQSQIIADEDFHIDVEDLLGQMFERDSRLVAAMMKSERYY
jgi:hypothetical protein